jgi:acetyl-CoA carboxylase biotin carboxyl carrier protein
LNELPRKATNPRNEQPDLTHLDLKQIKQIIELMKRSELTEFAVEEEGFKLKIRRGGNGLPLVSTTRGSNSPFGLGTDNSSSLASSGANTSGMGSTTAISPNSLPPLPPLEEDTGIIFIKSPMVGTFYRSASPESKPFAESGTKVVENTVVCIIEAMKIMNEIQAEVKGTVIEVLVENGQPVEYGQRLFKVKQA